MNYRSQMFERKFKDAAKIFGTTPEQIVSVKLREENVSYEQYRNLVKILEQEARLHCEQIDGQLQGTAYLINDKQDKVIVVEHETGLEILYIAGSTASLIGLIPLIIQSWRFIHNHLFGRHRHNNDDIEIRHLDNKGHLQEENIHNDFDANTMLMNPLYISSISDMAVMRREIMELRDSVRKLSDRIESIENRVEESAIPTKHIRKNTKKNPKT
jgi:hypothetical protein